MGIPVDRIRRWLLPVLLVIVIITMLLVRAGVIAGDSLKYSLFIPAALELLLLMLCLINITRIIKRYRALKKDGWETMDAWQKSLELVLSPRLARWATVEPRLYYALYLSYKQKPSTDIKQFSTRMSSYSFFVRVIILLCFIEILAVTWLLPDKWMIWKVLHLVLGLWAVLWLWADYRAMGLYAHRISPTGMQFRLGLRYGQEIPWEAIRLVRKISQAPPGGAMAPQKFKNDPGVLYLGVGEICNMEIALKEPFCFQGMINDCPGVSHLLLSLEAPDDFITDIHLIHPGLCNSF